MKRVLFALMLAVSAVYAAVALPPSAVEAQSGLNVTGFWSTNWDGNNAGLTLRQSGSNVSGDYTTEAAPPGNVSGTFQGRTLYGRWVDQAGSSGGFALTFSADGRSFVGTWGSGGSVDDGGNWNGAR
jgi:hypothetical protein